MSARYKIGSEFPRELRLAHYANGRRLMAADLHRDQQSSLVRARQVGRAAGYGIVEGLVVERARLTYQKQAQAVTVSPGLAVNRLGDVIALSAMEFTLNLVSDPVALEQAQAGKTTMVIAGGAAVKGVFTGNLEECRDSGGPVIQPPPEPSPPAATLADGIYLLAVRPVVRDVSGIAEYADSGLGQCGLRWQDHGVEFRLILLDDPDLPDISTAGFTQPDSLFANRVAAWCMGHQTGAIHVSDPFNTHAPTGDDPLDKAGLEPDDVPLAVLLWTENHVAWVDNWAVRRRVVQPDPALAWEPLISDRRAALGEARFLQFQEQLAGIRFVALRERGDDEQSVSTLFDWLPPAGYLPVRCLPYIDNRVTLQDLEMSPRPLAALTVNSILAPAMAQMVAYWGIDQALAVEIVDLLKQVLLYLDKSYAENPTGGLIDLPSFWGQYGGQNELRVLAQVIDPHQALRLLHESWHDSAINLDMGEPVMVYVVSDSVRLWSIALSLLEQESSKKTDPDLDALREAWKKSPIREAMIKFWRKRSFAFDLEADAPLYAVFARQAPSWPPPEILG